MSAARDLFLWALAVCLVMLFRGSNPLMAGSVMLVFAGRELLWHRRGDLPLFLIGFVCGPAIEFAGTVLGVWTYAQPSFLNLPLWLPPAWGISAVVLFRVGGCLAGPANGR